MEQLSFLLHMVRASEYFLCRMSPISEGTEARARSWYVVYIQLYSRLQQSRSQTRRKLQFSTGLGTRDYRPTTHAPSVVSFPCPAALRRRGGAKSRLGTRLPRRIGGSGNQLETSHKCAAVRLVLIISTICSYLTFIPSAQWDCC